MGLTFVEGIVTGPNGRQRTLNFLVDSGATYTALPFAVWTDLALKPKREMDFVLADGTRMRRSISECHIALDLGDTNTPIIMGETEDEPLLGAVTLEELGLVLNPFKRQLQPMKAYL